MDEVLRPGEMKPKGSSHQQVERAFDVIELPSRGKLYNGTTLEGRREIEIYYLTAKDEDILTSPNLVQSGKMIDYLMKSVLKDKTINPDDLLLGDRNMILVWLRSTGYGEDYPVIIKCKECGETFNHTFDLSKMNPIYLEIDPDENNHFTHTLPASKKIVKFRLLTCGDETAIMDSNETKKKKMNQIIDSTGSLRLMKTIVSIDGSSDPIYLKSFIENMSAKDSRSLREYINSIEPGIDMKQEVTCLHCGNKEYEVAQIRPNFFWPDYGV